MLCGLSLPESLDFLLNAGVGLVIVKMGGRGARLVGRRVDLYVPPCRRRSWTSPAPATSSPPASSRR